MPVSDIKLSIKSMLNRKLTTGLTIFALALSLTLLIATNRISDSSKKSFEQTVAGTDLIVASRNSPLQLLLSTVFHIGAPSNTISIDAYKHFKNHPGVISAVPISLGDSHRGFPVIATDNNYINHLQYAGGKKLSFESGQWFSKPYEAVIGAKVAKKLGYALGRKIVLAHGTGEVVFEKHDNAPFVVAGILKATGTPIDRGVHINLQDLEHVHENYMAKVNHHESGNKHQSHNEHNHAEEHAHKEHDEHNHDEHNHAEKHAHKEHDEHDHSKHNEHHDHNHGEKHAHHEHDEHNHNKHDNHSGQGDHHDHDHSGDSITAFYLKLKNKAHVFQIQREINEYTQEPLSGIMPAVALKELWSIFDFIEKTLSAVGVVVLVVTMMVMLISLLTGLQARKREIALFRAVGAGPGFIVSLIIKETLVLLAFGCLLGFCIITFGLWLAGPWLESQLGIQLQLLYPAKGDLLYVAWVGAAAILCSLIPLYRAYRSSLVDGLSMRL